MPAQSPFANLILVHGGGEIAALPVPTDQRAVCRLVRRVDPQDDVCSPAGSISIVGSEGCVHGLLEAANGPVAQGGAFSNYPLLVFGLAHHDVRQQIAFP